MQMDLCTLPILGLSVISNGGKWQMEWGTDAQAIFKWNILMYTHTHTQWSTSDRRDVLHKSKYFCWAHIPILDSCPHNDKEIKNSKY